MDELVRKHPAENIDYALVPRGHSPMYVMHKFWARKPHNVVAEYIEHYTREGEIVLDPFVGSGVTALEAVKLGRKAIGIDLNPMSIFISRMTGKPADISSIQSAFQRVSDKVKDQIAGFYRTECGKCGGPATVLASIWDRVANELKEVRYSCARCRRRLRKKPTKQDVAAAMSHDRKSIRNWYPKDKFPDGITFAQGRREAGESFADLFTDRNLDALALLWKAISDLPSRDVREVLTFAFTSMVHLASKMTPVRPSRPFSSFWAINSYWVPPIFMESNVWMLFESSVIGRQGLVSAKEDSNSLISTWMEAKTFGELNKDSNILLKVANTLELAELLPENSVDYVFTDPPYGGAVPYAELTTLWALWKGFDINYADEITINDEKNFEYYHKMLQAAFRQVWRVLKSGKYLTVTFHSTDIKVWNSIINAVVAVGFDLEKIIYQPPARPSAKGLLVPYGSAVGDYYIRFRKPERARATIDTNLDESQYEKAVIAAAKRILAERGEPTPYTYILNGIIVDLKKAGVLLAGKRNPNKVMQAQLEEEFILVPEKDTKGKVLGHKWWFKDPASIPYLDVIPLTERVETAVVNVLHRSVKVSFDDVLQEIFIKFPNALTPETQRVRNLLEEYAKETKDGKWALKPIVHTRESEHSRLIYLLALMGKRAGLRVSIGLREQSEVCDGKKLGSLSTAVELSKTPEVVANRIRQIDLLWHSKGKVQAAFEVENTTAITEAIVRCSNIAEPGVMRFIVIPEERENLLYRKLHEPMLADRVTRDAWRFLKYSDVKSLFERTRRKPVSLRDIAKLAFTPKSSKRAQFSLSFDE